MSVGQAAHAGAVGRVTEDADQYLDRSGRRRSLMALGAVISVSVLFVQIAQQVACETDAKMLRGRYSGRRCCRTGDAFAMTVQANISMEVRQAAFSRVIRRMTADAGCKADIVLLRFSVMTNAAAPVFGLVVQDTRGVACDADVDMGGCSRHRCRSRGAGLFSKRAVVRTCGIIRRICKR